MPLKGLIRQVHLKLWVHRTSRSMATRGRCQSIEEQTLPSYDRKQYYPVKIGEILKCKYRIIAKLGYGAYSTVWLAKDQRFDTRLLASNTTLPRVNS